LDGAALTRDAARRSPHRADRRTWKIHRLSRFKVDSIDETRIMKHMDGMTGSVRHRRRSVRQRGFTLLELLVVIAIMALLMVLVMPSLRQAREQARSVVCLSHLGQVGQAATMYMADFNDALPIGTAQTTSLFLSDSGNLVTNSLTTCHWGGRRAAWQHGPIPENEIRPLTRYVYPGGTLDVPAPLFECPSDRPTEWSDSVLSGERIFEVCGNSYYLNMYGTVPSQKPQPAISPANVIVYMEAPLHELFATRQQGPGWHRRFSTHNVVFLDMHAAAQFVDSRVRATHEWNVTEFIVVGGFLE
jgi:prepilin-type N-terminal cleavage/methylation domain-containing protein